MAKKRLKGKVVSNKMDKTAVVEVGRIKQHPKYIKRYTVHKKYKVHDPENKLEEGETVMIEETRPISKDKRWRVIERIS